MAGFPVLGVDSDELLVDMCCPSWSVMGDKESIDGHCPPQPHNGLSATFVPWSCTNILHHLHPTFLCRGWAGS